MAITKQQPRNSVSQSMVPLTPLNLYLARVKSVTERIRATSAGYNYSPLQFGGIPGQQQSLLANSVVKLIDFKVSGDEE
jgi:hypothetical protein